MFLVNSLLALVYIIPYGTLCAWNIHISIYLCRTLNRMHINCYVKNGKMIGGNEGQNMYVFIKY